ncbi:MAG: substrate-binding domain-containing protein [Anaerolineales bacterium]|nr:substrate-binding domain-containing protein [Anaerolineales bacterium]HEY61777.1 substrate-binding domain-containing protein [Anaerolineae bacterium]
MNKKDNSHISRRDFLRTSAITAGAVALASCQKAPEATEVSPLPTEASAPAEVEQKDQTYVWLCAVTSVAFWLDGRKGMEAAGKALGVKTEFLGPQEYDASQQLKILDDLIGKKPAGIMIFPADVASLNDTMKRALKEDIPILCVNSDVNDESARYGFVGPNNRGVGRTGGAMAVELLGGKGKVAIMTVPGIEVHESRKGGYLDVFEKNDGIEVVDIVDDKSDPAYGVTVATQLVQAHPDLDMIIGTDATAGAAIARALKETGMAGKIKVIAMDRDQDMLPYVQDGTISATLAQNSVMEEWVATHYLYWLKNNTIPEFKDWRVAKAPQAPHYTDVGVSVVTKDNVGFYIHD